MDSGCKLPRELFTIYPSPSPSLSHSSPNALQCTANYHQIGGNLTKLYHTHDPTIGVSTLLRSWPADFVRHISHAPPWKAINYVVVVVVVAARYLLGIYSFLLLTRPGHGWYDGDDEDDDVCGGSDLALGIYDDDTHHTCKQSLALTSPNIFTTFFCTSSLLLLAVAIEHVLLLI